jgi:hypothetical protein
MARRLEWVCAGITAVLVATPGVGAQPLGTLSVAEGSVYLIRGTSLYTPAAGIRIHEGDILRTEPGALAEVQFTDATLLSLGPDTRLMVVAFSPAAADAAVAALSGWFKFAQKASPQPMTFRFTVPNVSLAAAEATGVVHAADAGAEAFVEAGSIQLSPTDARGTPGPPLVVKAGEYALARPGQSAALSRRPPQAFLAAMPGAFKDALPVLADRYRNRLIEPKREREVSYADIEGWLKAGVPVRNTFVKRFHSRAQDPEFRNALIRNLRDHPEWDRILFPQKTETTPR